MKSDMGTFYAELSCSSVSSDPWPALIFADSHIRGIVLATEETTQ